MMLYALSDDEGRLVAGPEKMNTAAPIPASTFTIHSVQHFEPTADSDGTVTLLGCAGESERTAREHIAATVEPAEDEPGGNPARAFVYDSLLTRGGEASVENVLEAGRRPCEWWTRATSGSSGPLSSEGPSTAGWRNRSNVRGSPWIRLVRT
jgi:hypothetical protein